MLLIFAFVLGVVASFWLGYIVGYDMRQCDEYFDRKENGSR